MLKVVVVIVLQNFQGALFYKIFKVPYHHVPFYLSVFEGFHFAIKASMFDKWMRTSCLISLYSKG